MGDTTHVSRLDVEDHDGSVGLALGGTTVTATAAQLNKANASGVIVVDSTTVDASGGGSGETTNLTNVPAGSILLDVVAVVDTAFDGDTTTTLEVGVSGNADKYIDTTDFDPSSSAGTYQAMTGGGSNDQGTTEWHEDAEQLIATWTNTASAAAGAVTVYAIYADLA